MCLRPGDIDVTPQRLSHHDLGEDVGHVRGGDRLHEQRRDRCDAVLFGPGRHHRSEVVELRGRDDRPRHGSRGHEAFLFPLARVVRVALDSVDPDYREQHVVTDAGPLLGGEQAPRGSAEQRHRVGPVDR
ncbi:hypothetical protein GCM10009609_62880 [Pseudonocardia aurantiaca]